MDRINIKGPVAPGFESVKSLFEKRIRELWEDNAQLCVYVGEEKVVDLAASNSENFSADSIVNVFSSGKNLEAIAMATLFSKGLLDYNAKFDATANGSEIDFVLEVRTQVTTLCPCSKAISVHGAHNQRGEVTVQLRSSETIWIEDVIELAEASASSELYSLLKRPDEKHVTERAYENPVFVEDLVRNVATRLNAHPHVTWYKVEVENFESIHNHNAYACIEKG